MNQVFHGVWRRVVGCFLAGLFAILPLVITVAIIQIVYLPTSPIPMTGGLLFVPRESVHSVNMTVEGLMSVYLSMGVTGPKFLKGDGAAS